MAFSELYLAAREKEGRIFRDDEVYDLPNVFRGHPHYDEWIIRGKSCKKLIDYLALKKKPLQILEIGCGNGWLSARMASIPDSTVTGLDINEQELQQAKRVFCSISNLRFVYGDILQPLFQGKQFDIIVFAASMQYFPSVPGILQIVMELLGVDGEIHIIDTIFYSRGEVSKARQRTASYYSSLGIPELAAHYFHHCIEDLKNFNYKKIDPVFSFTNKFGKPANPFSWISVRSKI